MSQSQNTRTIHCASEDVIQIANDASIYILNRNANDIATVDSANDFIEDDISICSDSTIIESTIDSGELCKTGPRILEHLGDQRHVTYSNIHIENSTDILLGTKAIFNEPVVIQQVQQLVVNGDSRIVNQNPQQGTLLHSMDTSDCFDGVEGLFIKDVTAKGNNFSKLLELLRQLRRILRKIWTFFMNSSLLLLLGRTPIIFLTDEVTENQFCCCFKTNIDRSKCTFRTILIAIAVCSLISSISVAGYFLYVHIDALYSGTIFVCKTNGTDTCYVGSSTYACSNLVSSDDRPYISGHTTADICKIYSRKNCHGDIQQIGTNHTIFDFDALSASC